MNIIRQIINEEISAIVKDKDNVIFNYGSIINDAWRDKVYDAQKFQRINFDLENNDSTGEKKTFYVKKKLRRDQPIKYEINAELMEAGGDWEMPVMYFRLEFTHEYFYGNEKFKNNPEFVWDLEKKSYGGLHNNYVIIPPVEAGNKIVKGKSDSGKYDWFAYQNDGLSKDEEKEARITDDDKKNVWKWLEELLNKLVDDRHEMLDKEDSVSKRSGEPMNESKYSRVKNSLMRSKSITDDMKKKILKYLTSGSEYHEGGNVTGLVKPDEFTKKSLKSSGVSMGADKDGFFVYTHRARSKSYSSPDKISVKDINFIESTG